MILYINGDSHSAGAEITPNFLDNESMNKSMAFGATLANSLGFEYINEASSGASNYKIIRTAEEFLSKEHNDDIFVIIGWSTWEREEWLHDGEYYQITSSGTDQLPVELQQQYKEWVVNMSPVECQRRMLRWHSTIYDFHQKLTARKINHLFFNTYMDFSQITNKQLFDESFVPPYPEPVFWNHCYVNPYNSSNTYFYWLQNRGFKPATEKSFHYKKDAHDAWANFLKPHVLQLI